MRLGGAVNRILLIVDEISTWVGKTAGWCIVILTFTTSYEVFSRYLFLRPTEWAFDAAYMLYGTLFMLAGAYTLARNGHVRGDFIYRSWAPSKQAKWDLVLYILFFFPGMLAFVYAGYKYAELSWMMKERSAASPFGPPVYHFKTLIPITGVLMVMQGIVEVIRCVQCIQTGEWPKRLHDVEELEKVIMADAEKKQGEATQAEAVGAQKGAV